MCICTAYARALHAHCTRTARMCMCMCACACACACACVLGGGHGARGGGAVGRWGAGRGSWGAGCMHLVDVDALLHRLSLGAALGHPLRASEIDEIDPRRDLPPLRCRAPRRGGHRLLPLHPHDEDRVRARRAVVHQRRRGSTPVWCTWWACVVHMVGMCARARVVHAHGAHSHSAHAHSAQRTVHSAHAQCTVHGAQCTVHRSGRRCACGFRQRGVRARRSRSAPG